MSLSARQSRFAARPPRAGRLVAALLGCCLLGGGAVRAQPAAVEIAAARQTAAALQQAVAKTIASAAPSIVAIARQRLPDPAWPQHPAQRRALQAGPADKSFLAQEWCCGVVVRGDGMILAPYHALGDPSRNRYWVWLPGRKTPQLIAEIRAATPWMDLALLQADARGLQPIAFGDSDACFQGQFVVAVGGPAGIAQGRPPASGWGTLAQLNQQAPVTSSRPETAGRETLYHFGALLQTDFDASQLGGGSALLDLDGKLIGLATTLANRQATDRPDGLAIPFNQATLRVVQEMSEGRPSDFGFLGIEPVELSPAARQRGLSGVEVRDVVFGTPAEKAGLRRGDVITAVSETPIDDPLDITRLLSRYPAGQRVQLAVLRNSRPLTLETQLAKRPSVSLRPEIHLAPPRLCRGMHIDYGSVALASRRYSSQLRGRSPLAVLDVQPDSPAWKSGIRGGDLILAYQGQSSLLPADFFAVAENLEGPLNLEVLSQGEFKDVVVPP